MKQLLVSVFALCGKIKVEVSVVTQSLDYSEYRKNRQSSNNNSPFWCVACRGSTFCSLVVHGCVVKANKLYLCQHVEQVGISQQPK